MRRGQHLQKAFLCVLRFWWLYLFVAVLLVGLPLFLKSNSGSMAGAISYIFFVLFLHRYFLFGDGAEASMRSSWSFIWVNLLVTIGAGALVLGGLLLAPSNPVSQAILASSGLLILAFLPAVCMVLSVFGTALHASAANQPYGLMLTLRRSRQTALGIAWRLLVGPGLFGFVTMAVALVGRGAFAVLVGIDKAQMATPTLQLRAVDFGFETGLQLIVMTASTLAVALLCDAYRHIQPAPVDAAA